MAWPLALFPSKFLVNKVPGYWLKGWTALENRPSTLQIFAPSKFGINRTTGSKVMTKKLFWSQMNFLAITSEPVVRSIRNFEGEKICMVDGLFSNAVQPLFFLKCPCPITSLLGNGEHLTYEKAIQYQGMFALLFQPGVEPWTSAWESSRGHHTKKSHMTPPPSSRAS